MISIRWSRQELHSMLLGCKHQFEFVELACCNILMNIPNDIFENSVFWKHFSKPFAHAKMKFNSFIYYLQWNGVYILCISSVDSKSTSISLFHHEWSTRDLLTLKNFLFATCLFCLDHILVSLTSENFDWTELKKVWPINSRTKIRFERF